jgi:hypothetical protein
MGDSYILRWNHEAGARYAWYIFGIRSDLSFFGEITFYFDAIPPTNGTAGKQVNVSGALAASDYARFVALVDRIKSGARNDRSDSAVEGVLAQGPISHPLIIYRYHRGVDENSEEAKSFLQIVEIFSKYLPAAVL